MVDFSKLRKALGLADDTADDAVIAKVAERIEGDSKEKSKLSTVLASLSSFGLRVEGEKVVKLSNEGRADLEIRDGDAPDLIDLKKRLKAQMDINGANHALAASKMADDLIKEGKATPAMKPELVELLSIMGEVPSCSLSTDGKTPVQGLVKAAEAALRLFQKLPKLTGEKLSQMQTMEGGDKDPNKSQELSAEQKKAEYKKLAARIDPALASRKE